MLHAYFLALAGNSLLATSPFFGPAKCAIIDTPLGTEELAHWEMLGTMIYQCLRGASLAEIEAAGLSGYYTLHNHAVFPSDPNGVPFTTAYIQATGDPVTDLVEDLAAEQKARTAYEHIMSMTNDPALLGPLRFLREREVVHYQRFGECLEIVQRMVPNNNEKVRFVANGRIVTTGDGCHDICPNMRL